MSIRRRPTLAALASFGAAALVLAGCADTSGGANGGGGSGVGPGATIQEYQDAFADMDPITLHTQSPAPQGSPVGKNFEAYFDAVEEWSGGKLTFDIAWANSVAPAPDVDEALADGRLDVGSVMAGYEPDVYPAYAALSDSSFMGNGSPLEMIMTPHGYINELGWENEQVRSEFEDQGLRILAPAFTGGINGVFCSEPGQTLEELSGRQVRISGAAHEVEAQALGMTPVSLAFEEVYEALQRGVLDCAFSGVTVVSLYDLLSVAPNAILANDVNFGQVPSALSVSTATFDSLPLVAQQLLHDRADVFIESNMEGLVEMFREVLGEIEPNDGSLNGLAPEALQALNDGNDQFLTQIAEDPAVDNGGELVESVRTSSADWREVVAELGYDVSVDYNDFSEWATENEIDFTPFMDRIRDIQNANRPS